MSDCCRRPGARDTACRCSPECRALATRARRERAERAMRGVPAMYPASMVATRVMLLLRRNPHTTTADVARAAGVPVRTITRMLSQLADDPDRRVRAATAHAVMTATIAIDPAGGALVDGTVTRRKVEALACAGWPVTAVAPRLGCPARR